jgi:hypothetical protein
MWTLAGKTETRRPSSHQRPNRRVAGCRTATAPTISAAPADRDGLLLRRLDRRRHDRFEKARPEEVDVPVKVKKVTSAVRECLIRRAVFQVMRIGALDESTTS